MARVLVLGGTGHIGAAISRAFDGAGHEVRASGRSSKPRVNLQGTGVEQVAGDDMQQKNVEDWADGVDLIVDAATPYPVSRHGIGKDQVVAASRARIRTILDLAKRQKTAIIHISSFTTLPASGSLQDRLRLATVRGMHPYFEVKEVVEREVLSALGSGLQGCVLNPTACFGPYDLKPPEQAYIPMLLQGKVVGTVRHPINVVDVRDVAGCGLASLQRGFPHRQVPVVGNNIRVDELTRQICQMAGVPVPKLRAPLMLALAGTYWIEAATAAMGRDTPWASLPILLTAAGRSMPLSPAQQALGIQPRPLGDTLRDALASYLDPARTAR